MISLTFQNPNKKFSYNHQQGRGGHNPHHKAQQYPIQQHQHVVTPINSYQSGNTLSVAAINAARLNISVIEWQRRNEIVSNLVKQCDFAFMEEFFPCNQAYYTRFGKCIFLGKPKGYSEIDREAWPADDNPLVFSVRPLAPIDGADTAPFFCNLQFMCKEAPTQ